MRSIITALEFVGGKNSRTEMDSHADSPVVGNNAYIISTQDKKITVNGFTNNLSSKTVLVVDAAVVYDCKLSV